MRKVMFGAVVLTALLTACNADQPPIPPPSNVIVESAAVPDVVGMVHQDAQNAMQKAGFYYLTEEDATGQGRMLVSDRNWVVVEQVPAAGTSIPKSDKILLRSKKTSDA